MKEICKITITEHGYSSDHVCKGRDGGFSTVSNIKTPDGCFLIAEYLETTQEEATENAMKNIARDIKRVSEPF